jgi:hypothetical protein
MNQKTIAIIFLDGPISMAYYPRLTFGIGIVAGKIVHHLLVARIDALPCRLRNPG